MKLSYFLNGALLFSAISVRTIVAQNYFISSSELVSGSGTFSSPWNSFDEINTLFAASGTVDTVFLMCGDTFRDEMNVVNTGNFVITSYGFGAQPVISGADTVTGWTPVSSYWQADFLLPVTHFFAAHQEQIPAREPNEGSYFLVDAASISDLTSSDLSAFSSAILDASQVCVHTQQWCWEKSPVASSSGSVITYDIPTLKVPTAEYGFFLYDEISFLNAGKEWIYDAVAQKINYQPTTGDPNDLICEASVRDYGIELGFGVVNVKIDNIAFEKQANSGVAILDASNTAIVIDNCTFARQYMFGVDVQGIDVEISNCYFREVDGFAVYLNGSAEKSEVHHNTFRNNGGFRNSGIGQEINLSSIKGTFVDSCHIHHNDIDSAGYCGIAMDGMWNIVERNIVKNVMLLNNDGAALKSFGPASQFNIFQNNFVSLGDGNTEGNPVGPPDSHFSTPAIYFDFNTNNCTIHENTIYDHTQRGLFLNSGSHTNTVTDNVVYGGKFLIDFNGSPVMPTPMTGMTVKHNVFFAKDPAEYLVRMLDNTGGYNHGEVDSNYYFQPYDDGKYALEVPSTSMDFVTWQSTSAYDANTKNSFVSWTLPVSLDTLIMNPTDDVVTVDLGTTKYLDLDSNDVCGDITLQPYTSVILISTETECDDVGISETNLLDFRLFPNPANTCITVQCDDVITELVVLDLTGRSLEAHYPCDRELLISTENLSSGIYVARYKKENGTVHSVHFAIAR